MAGCVVGRTCIGIDADGAQVGAPMRAPGARMSLIRLVIGIACCSIEKGAGAVTRLHFPGMPSSG